MTSYELAERDLRKAERGLEQARRKRNVPREELEHLEMLRMLRQEIFELISAQK